MRLLNIQSFKSFSKSGRKKILLYLLILCFGLAAYYMFHPFQNASPCKFIEEDYTLFITGKRFIFDPICLELYEDRNKVRMVKHLDGSLENRGCTTATSRCGEIAHFDQKRNRRLNLPPCCRMNCIMTYRDVVDLFEKYGVRYCLYGGTVLGLVRHDGHMIPYDDDIDMIVDERDRLIFNSTIKAELGKLGRIVKQPKNPHQTHIAASKTNKIAVDVFWFAYTKNGMINTYFHYRKHPKSMFFPVKRDIFEGKMVNVPNKPKEFVVKQYGKAWNAEMTCERRFEHNCKQ